MTSVFGHDIESGQINREDFNKVVKIAIPNPKREILDKSDLLPQLMKLSPKPSNPEAKNQE